MNEYYQNFITLWNLHGGLISQAEAAKILKKTPGRIAQMITENKLTKIGKYVSFTEICKIAQEYEK